jgi:FHA domain
LQPPFSFPPLTELAPEVSAQTAKVVMAALDKDVANRPASALAMRDLLPKPVDGDAPSVARAGIAARPAVLTAATVVLDRPTASPRSATPRTIGQNQLPAKPAVLPKASASHPVPAAVPAKRHSPSQLRPAANVATQRGLHPQPAARPAEASSISKTADLGLKKPQGPVAEAARISTGEPNKVIARMASALASMRAAISVGPPATTASVNPVAATDKVSSLGRSPVSAWPLAGNPAPKVGSANGVTVHASMIGEITHAHLVSVDGMRFGVLGGRTVLGRANSERDRVDIDLSKLRRGAERISRRHAEIIKQGNDYFVRDLGSVNGTYIAGRGRLGRDQLYKLKDRDELVLGGAKLEFRRS